MKNLTRKMQIQHIQNLQKYGKRLPRFHIETKRIVATIWGNLHTSKIFPPTSIQWEWRLLAKMLYFIWKKHSLLGLINQRKNHKVWLIDQSIDWLVHAQNIGPLPSYCVWGRRTKSKGGVAFSPCYKKFLGYFIEQVRFFIGNKGGDGIKIWVQMWRCK